ncbi:CRISPR-associated protein Cas4 [Chondromyces apiculatus]|uniref:CRISPR-associated exonuclease Cas4 n=1 Tax=Chondromyces apiculatus DSM 436 TaxID=1192034 RepID=A0A017T950_9BACT|nr:CRISPR-associated protein Cas4 [Chondromyces apiculatus]EYF05345.1 CRISPR-associated RecB family exonuclease Cas4b [Chondromyces apiculatus DSM 436]
MTQALSETDALVALSGLQHLVFCERQAALIHVEQVWREDGATAAGRVLHERADLPGGERRRGVRVERSVMLCSRRLGVYGRADAVEYHPDRAVPGGHRPFPVEYKRGKQKHLLADQVQLCAQAMCLEEMHALDVLRGALFYGESHRRVEVTFDPALREATASAARRLHQLVAERLVPAVAEAPRCRKCSLAPSCLPSVTAAPDRARRYLQTLIPDP